MHFNYYYSILLLSIVFKNGLGVLFEGDLCTIPSEGANGICKLFSSCSSAMESLVTQGIYPTNCGFEKNEPIVCCVNAPTLSVTEGITTTTTTITTSKSKTTITPSTLTQKVNLQIGDKSKQKCKEYGKYAYESSGIVPLPGRSPLPPVLVCTVIEVENIVGGTPAKSREFPHMALVGFDGDNNEIKWGCGGSLISEKFVLSAAHCTFHMQYLYAKYILLGELVLDSSIDDAQPQQTSIKKIIRHPQYRYSIKYHDIALFEMERNAILNTYTRPGCLNTNPSLTNRLAVASGWGETSKGSESKDLQKVILTMFTNTECNSTYKGLLSHGIEGTQLCAGSRNDSKDTCQGDSGGPLQIINKEVLCTYNIIGVTSFGRRCGVLESPAVYTRVSAYIKWIEDIVWP